MAGLLEKVTIMLNEAKSLCFAFAAFTVIASLSTAAQAGAGRQLAKQKCASCHAIGEDDSSSNPNAPPFRALHRRYPVDAVREAFLKGLEVGHRDMPTFILTPQEITDIISFLRDLDPCGQPSSDSTAMAKCFAPVE